MLQMKGFPMKKLTLLVIGGLWSFLSFGQVSVSPSTTIKLGEIVEGTVASAVFKLTNTSPGKIKIDHIQAACGCTTAEPSKKELAPGETSEIKVIFDSKNRLGEFHKPVTVYLTGNGSTQQELSLVGKVINPAGAAIELDQNRIEMGVVAFGKTQVRTFPIRNRGTEALIINQVDFGRQKLLTSPLTIQPNSSYMFSLNVPSPSTPGIFSEYLTISSNDAREKKKVISVLGWYEARVGVTIVKEKEFNLFFQVRISNDSDKKVMISDFIPKDKYEITSGGESLAPGESATIQVMKGTIGQLKF